MNFKEFYIQEKKLEERSLADEIGAMRDTKKFLSKFADVIKGISIDSLLNVVAIKTHTDKDKIINRLKEKGIKAVFNKFKKEIRFPIDAVAKFA